MDVFFLFGAQFMALWLSSVFGFVLIVWIL